MEALKGILEANGYQDVQTYIQSGNVVVKSPKQPDATEIGALVQKNFGFTPNVMVLDEPTFVASLKNNPFNPTEGKTLQFYFCKNTPQLDVKKIEALCAKSEAYHCADKVFYLYAPDGIGRSKLAGKMESCLGVPATARNLNTVKKLQMLVTQI